MEEIILVKNQLFSVDDVLPANKDTDSYGEKAVLRNRLFGSLSLDAKRNERDIESEQLPNKNNESDYDESSCISSSLGSSFPSKSVIVLNKKDELDDNLER